MVGLLGQQRGRPRRSGLTRCNFGPVPQTWALKFGTWPDREQRRPQADRGDLERIVLKTAMATGSRSTHNQLTCSLSLQTILNVCYKP